MIWPNQRAEREHQQFDTAQEQHVIDPRAQENAPVLLEAMAQPRQGSPMIAALETFTG